MPGNTTNNQSELFNGIAALVRADLEAFRDTGRLLDQEYSESEIRRRHRNHRRRIQRRNAMIRERNAGLPEQDQQSELVELSPLGRRRMSRAQRFQRAWDAIRHDPPEFAMMRQEDQVAMARQIVLMTWIVTDPDADHFTKLTEFQTGGWSPTNSEIPHLTNAELAANDRWSLFFVTLRRTRDAWMPLVEQAVGILSTLDAPPEDNDDFKPGEWFSENTRIPTSRLRQAATENRQTKRVKKRGKGRGVRYSVTDAKAHWPQHIEKEA